MITNTNVSTQELIAKTSSDVTIRNVVKDIDLLSPDSKGNTFLDYVVDLERTELLGFCFEVGLFQIVNGEIWVNGNTYKKKLELLLLLIRICHISVSSIDVEQFNNPKVFEEFDKLLENKEFNAREVLGKEFIGRVISLIIVDSYLKGINYDGNYRTLTQSKELLERVLRPSVFLKLSESNEGRLILNEVFKYHRDVDRTHFSHLPNDIVEDFFKWRNRESQLEIINDLEKLKRINVPKRFKNGEIEIIDAYIEKFGITKAGQIISCLVGYNNPNELTDWHLQRLKGSYAMSQRPGSSNWNFYDADFILYLARKGIEPPLYSSDESSWVDPKYLAILSQALAMNKK